jgi:hypothetical protein
MDKLNWRTVAELKLTSPAVPNPDSTSDLLQNLNSVRVAIADGLVHIDPRPTNGPVPPDVKAEYTVTAVPTSAVEYIRYQEVPKSKRMTVM